MAFKKMLLNIPVSVDDAKYLDVVSGQYGAQLRIKGTIDGEQGVSIYLPGKIWAVAKALKTAGVVAHETAIPEDVTEAVAIPMAAKTFTMVNEQVPGQKYANLSILVGGAVANTVAPKKAADPLPEWLAEGDTDDLPFDVAPGGVATKAAPTVAKAAPVKTVGDIEAKLAPLFAVHDAALAHALAQHVPNDTADAVSARAATLFIQAVQQGIRA